MIQQWSIRTLCFAICLMAGVTDISGDIVLDMTTIGNPGNVPDTPYPITTIEVGAVDYIYRISTYEITVAQYTEFLNLKAASDPYGLYHTDMAFTGLDGGAFILRNGTDGSYTYTAVAGKENQPVRMVNFYDGLRLANWMHNGQGDGDTETGAYTLSLGPRLNREPGARWALASHDEWHKAAYYDPDTGTYWEYPNGKNTIEYPTDQTTPREQNFGENPYWAPEGPLNRQYFTSTGQTTGQSAYGVCDMGGNVEEWTDTRSAQGAYRVSPGGSFVSSTSYLARAGAITRDPAIESSARGLRLVFLDIIPEPASCILLLLGGAGILGLKRRRKR